MSFDPFALAAVLISPAFLYLAVRYWRGAIFSVFVLIVIEGALRKWVFPGAQAQIYLLKDIIILCSYLGFLLYPPEERGVAGLTGLKALLLSAFLFGMVEVLNPNSPSILVGLIGLKAYFLYVPLAFILPFVFQSSDELFRFVKIYLVLAIPVALLGFLQIASGPDSLINTYVSHSEDSGPVLAYFGHDGDVFVRTSGTFSYISGYTTFLGFIALLAIGYNMARGWRVWEDKTTLAALTLVVGAMFTTGSRAPVFSLIVAIPVILGLGLLGKALSPKTTMRMFLLIPIIGVTSVWLSPAALQAFSDRAREGDLSYVVDRTFPISQAIDALANGPLFGMGIGTAQNAALNIMNSEWPWWLGADLLFEDEMARVIVELGVVGMFLIYLSRILIVIRGIRCMMSFADVKHKALSIVLIVHLSLAFVLPVIINVTASFYYWISFGLILAMKRFEQNGRAADAKRYPIASSAQAEIAMQSRMISPDRL
jgi:hypothetical protein